MFSVRTAPLKSLSLAIALTFVCSATVHSPAAQAGMPVIDLPHQLQNVLTQIRGMTKDAVEYGKTATRWYRTLKQYEQQLVRLAGVIRSFGMPSGQSLDEVADDYMVEERCGAGGGGLLKAITPERDGDWLAQQRKICTSIQMLENTKFNETVRFLRRTLPQMQSDLGRMARDRSSNNDNGTVDGSTNQAAIFETNIEVEMHGWNTRMAGYEQMIKSLEQAQRQLARSALKGDSSAVGALVKTKVLETALKVGN